MDGDVQHGALLVLLGYRPNSGSASYRELVHAMFHGDHLGLCFI